MTAESRRSDVDIEDEDATSAGQQRFDRERTRNAILAAARQEFAEHGLSGARVEAIAARTNTVKRMIYYYFGSKEGLYLAVLEEAYADIRRFEAELKSRSISAGRSCPTPGRIHLRL